MSAPVPIIDANASYVAPTPAWFASHESSGADSVRLVSIVGAQSSGKSTLLNALFSTTFPVAPRQAPVGMTTKGVMAGTVEGKDLMVVLDVEGSDSRERGKKGKDFVMKCAALMAAVSDVIMVNLWYHEVGRFDGGGYDVLGGVFKEAVRQAEGGGGSFRTTIVFVVRDVDEEVAEGQIGEVLKNDAQEVFASISKDGVMDDLFNIVTVCLPHMRHRKTEFDTGVARLRSMLLEEASEGFLGGAEFSKSIPADGCGTFTQSLWGSMDVESGGLGERAVAAEGDVMAFVKCNEAFSEAFSAANVKMGEISNNGAVHGEGEKIDGYGQKAANIMEESLALYDEMTAEFADDDTQARKRRELESIIDTTQHAVFMKQLQLLRENALAQFKSATTADDMPSEFAFFTADSMFQREAEESKRPGSSWSFKQERSDLQSMMQEISTQRKRLMNVQVSAAQQQAHAMQFLQMQQSQMNAIQAQAYGASSGQWNLGAAYRPPDTNINASLSYQQGRTNIQISMVPDESASLLGPNGFTAGVGPGNLGLSFNIGL